jgi:hypothetical protein
VQVLEHVFRDGRRACSIYGHAAPVSGILVGAFVPIGKPLAAITDYRSVRPGWVNHLHFGVHEGPFGAKPGAYPSWLKGYLAPQGFPAGYVDPYAFVRSRHPALRGDTPLDFGLRRRIRSNEPLEGEGIYPAADEDWFVFPGRAGQRVSLSVARESDDLIPALGLRLSRDGELPWKPVADSEDKAVDGRFTRADRWYVALDDFVLPSDGEYLVEIRGMRGTTGLYRFTKRVV